MDEEEEGLGGRGQVVEGAEEGVEDVEDGVPGDVDVVGAHDEQHVDLQVHDPQPLGRVLGHDLGDRLPEKLGHGRLDGEGRKDEDDEHDDVGDHVGAAAWSANRFRRLGRESARCTPVPPRPPA